MKGKKTKIPNIIKKHINVPCVDEIGVQPTLIKPAPTKIKKKPLPTNKDLFYVNGSKCPCDKKKRYPKKHKPAMVKLLESMNNIDIHSNQYKKEQKMRGFRKAVKNIR